MSVSLIIWIATSIVDNVLVFFNCIMIAQKLAIIIQLKFYYLHICEKIFQGSYALFHYRGR